MSPKRIRKPKYNDDEYLLDNGTKYDENVPGSSDLTMSLQQQTPLENDQACVPVFSKDLPIYSHLSNADLAEFADLGYQARKLKETVKQFNTNYSDEMASLLSMIDMAKKDLKVTKLRKLNSDE